MKYSIFALLLSIVLLGLLPLHSASDSVEINTEGEVKKEVKKNNKKKKNWSTIDFNAIEKEWEGGDDERELEQEFELDRKQREKRAKKMPKSKEEAIRQAKKDPLGLNMGSGGTMMFAKLRKQQKKGVDWTNKAVDKVAGKWSSLLRSAAFDVKVVNIGAQGGEDTEVGTLLLSVDKAWNTYDVVKFVLKQKITDKVTVNSKEYRLKDLPTEEDD